MQYESKNNKSESLCCCSEEGCCKGKGCCIKVSFWVALVLASIFVIAGAILLPIGLDHADQASGLDAQADFTALDSECQIVSVEYIGEQQQRCSTSSGKSSSSRDCGCTDTYFYRFDASQLADVEGFTGAGDNYVFNSIKFDVKRPDVNSCGSSSPAVPTRVAGDQLQCWRPTDPNKELPWQYKCGNDSCVKVFDPQEDVDNALAVSAAMWISGTILLSLFVVIVCGLIPCYVCIKRMTSSSDQELPMTTTQPPANEYTDAGNNYNSNYNDSSVPVASASGPVTYYK